MKNYKWNTEKYTDEVHVVLFTSRNKDNKNVEHFKQRRKAFLTTRSMDDSVLISEFIHFAQ